MVAMKTSSCFSAQWFLRISSVSTVADLCNELPKDRWAPRKLCSIWSFGEDGNSYRHLYCRTFYRCTGTERREEIRTWVRRPEIIQTVFRCGFEVLYSWNRSTTDATFMPRMCDASQWERTRRRGWILKNTRIGPVLDKKSSLSWCDRYSIKVQIPSLFQDNTVSCVRIVNDVDKYVTESMLLTKEEDTASVEPIAKARPRQKPKATLTSVSIPVLERKWVDIETHDHTIISVMKCQKPSPGWHDMIFHSLVQEEEVRRCFAMATWRLDIDPGTRRRSEDKISIFAWIQTLPINSCTFSNSRTFRRQCCWSYIARQCTVTERIYRVHLPHLEREWIEFYNKKWTYSRRNKPQREERSSSLQWTRWKTYMAWKKLHAFLRKQGSRHTRILGNGIKIQYLVVFEVLSRDRLAILPETVTRCRSPQHTVCSLHWESGMCEISGGGLPEGALNPRVPRVVLKTNLQYCPQDPQS